MAKTYVRKIPAKSNLAVKCRKNEPVTVIQGGIDRIFLPAGKVLAEKCIKYTFAA